MKNVLRHGREKKESSLLPNFGWFLSRR